MVSLIRASLLITLSVVGILGLAGAAAPSAGVELVVELVDILLLLLLVRSALKSAPKSSRSSVEPQVDILIDLTSEDCNVTNSIQSNIEDLTQVFLVANDDHPFERESPRIHSLGLRDFNLCWMQARQQTRIAI